MGAIIAECEHFSAFGASEDNLFAKDGAFEEFACAQVSAVHCKVPKLSKKKGQSSVGKRASGWNNSPYV
jgi:hypothetical protein